VIGNKADSLATPDLLFLFDTPHKSKITWNHLLRQTSDWEGTLWGTPDWADRPSDKWNTWLTRPRNEPGSSYKYNDTRVNVLALAATNVWRRPLPQVLKENIMDPIGASDTWRWFGYEDAWIVLDGVPVQAVSGGGHWGGGMFINAYDMARFGYPTLNPHTVSAIFTTTGTRRSSPVRRPAPSPISAAAPISSTSILTTTWWWCAG
jgi:CubicO group peptidase (beta-lactamase class C family)